MKLLSDRENQTEALDFNSAMRRLTYLVAVGCSFILLYGLWQKSIGVVSVSLMSAGAALLTGGLLGFLFGVPHVREGDTPSENISSHADNGDAGAATASSPYRPSTSLEQISDWLTKILVGVGLVDVRDIIARVLRMADYIAPGLMGNRCPHESAKVFALTILIYFSIAGFVFGFLWARLYLPRWFAEADQVKRLLSRFELQMQSDAQVLGLCHRLLNPTQDGAPINDDEIGRAMKNASTRIKAQAFDQAQVASEDKTNPDYQARLRGAIAIFQGLAADDVEQKYHRNYSELSHALGRLRPPNWEEAKRAIEKAIQIRNRMHLSGWQYYEFRMARTLIEGDSKFASNIRSDPAFVKEVERNLVTASRRQDRWVKWLEEGNGIVKRWMQLNEVVIPQTSS